jgi:hypothetical protein
MIIEINHTIFEINTKEFGGILFNMEEEKYTKVNMSHLDSDLFNIFANATDLVDIPTKDIVSAFKLADYLNAEPKMIVFGKEIARRIQLSTYNGIKHIYNYFM